MLTIKKIILVTSFFCSVLFITGCSTSTETSFNDEFDFTVVKTYSLFPRESKFTELQEMSDFQRNRIELAVEKQMELQNFSYTQFEQADVIISYFLVGNSLSELKKYNKGVKACLGCSQNEQAVLNKDIRTSMLVLDVLDSDKKRSIFRGYTKLDLDPEDTSEENQQETIEAVQLILSQFPPEIKQ
ncbi:DUF4136 domain-containing protein [Thalassotalea psychrophila]|uniref:DUF4136 domain-containing protein n=1 Tax=Thalassotalea psychrophila TaxID=3065647 RepID=A0ABY9TS94_9GAMM|nr:DUF4136 domain-containing protein [Colwelliaceae bacterium SQ149]